MGLLPWGSVAPVKAYNNIFFQSKAINANCNQTIPPIDFVNNIVVDPELTIGAGWIYGDCPETVAQFKTKHIAYNLIWKDNHPCYDNHEYCDNFLGKVSADPMFIEPVIDQRGMAAWANFDFKEGSPAINAGDPSIPGGRNLGISGGPCADGNSSMCSDFIKQQSSQPAPSLSPISSIPTSQPYNPPPNDNLPLQPTSPPSNINNPPITYYLPPTMGFTNPNQPPNNPPAIGENIPTPTITPTPKPMIDMVKTVENVKNTWQNFITSLLQFTKTILP